MSTSITISEPLYYNRWQMLAKLNKFKGVLAVVAIVTALILVALPGKAEASQSGYWNDDASIKIGESGMDTISLGEIKAAIGSAQIDTQETGETSLKVQILKFAAGGVMSNLIANKLLDFKNQVTSGKRDYYFSPTKSLKAGFPVFQDPDSKRQLLYPMFKEAPRVGVRWPTNNSEGNYSPPDSAAAILTFEYETDGKKASTEKVNGLPVCSMSRYDNCWEKGNGGRAVKLTAAEKEKLEKTVSTFSSSFAATANDIKSGGCDAGALDFILCPITELLTEVNEAILGFITKGLVVQTGGFADDSGQLRQLFDKILLLSNGLFALIFIVIVFGNTLSLGIDAYTIKKALPRLVIAVVLAQFSYFVAGSIIEIGNVLSQGILALFSNQTLQVELLGSTVNGVASILLEITFLLIAFVAVLVGIFVLAIRQIIIVGLMITGPLAFAAWVLPNTDKAFKFWISNLVKLSMMGPIIVGMLAGSFVLKGAIDASGGNWIVQLGGAALPIIALLYLPKTFKWSGSLMSNTGSKIASFGSDQAKKQTVGRAKKEFSKDGGLKDRATATGLTPTLGSRNRLEAIGAAEDRRQKAAETGASRAARIIGAMEGGKNHSDKIAQNQPLTPDEAAEHSKYTAKQKAVADYTKTLKTPEAQAKFAASLAKSGDRTSVATVREAMGSRWSAGVAANYGDYDAMPDMRKTHDEWNNAPAVAATATTPAMPAGLAGKAKFVKDLNAESFVKTSGATQKALSSPELLTHFNSETLERLGDQGVRSRLGTDALNNLRTYKATLAAGNPHIQALSWLP